MRILIITPANTRSRAGNRITAVNWSRTLRQLGHKVTIDTEFHGQPCDLFVALHARRSAKSIAKHARQRPNRPRIVVLTGTDLYLDIHHYTSVTRSLSLATRLVVLQPQALDELTGEFRDKTHVIYQSASPPRVRPRVNRSAFEISVIGHLRRVKDPFRAAYAARRLDTRSRVRIVQIGQALSDSMQRLAEAEMCRNSRYTWLGELPHWKTKQRLARSRALVMSSKMEGGANVLSEAIAASIPVISSSISGAIGMLGEDYPGYFEYGNTEQLRERIIRCENDVKFLGQLRDAIHQRRSLVSPAREKRSWRRLIDELTYPSRSRRRSLRIE